MYVLASPHPRLYVEVGAVKGCVPSDVALGKLRDFLATYCNKPGGIEIVRDEVIPRNAARRVSPGALARKYMKGPPQRPGAPPPAFMYILCYDGDLTDEPPISAPGHLASKMMMQRRPPARNPRTDILPYPFIYMNMHYCGKIFRGALLLHEAGHMLGLVGRTNYAASHHCLDPDCLMNKEIHVTIHIRRLLLGSGAYTFGQKQLCKRCVAELAGKLKEPPPNLRFVGPVLVRSEDGYQVLSLPSRAELVVGGVNEKDCRQFAAAVRGEAPTTGNNEGRVSCLVKDEAFGELAKMRDALKRAKTDLFEPVQLVAAKAWLKSGAAAYYFAGQFTNAVNGLRENILADPKDDWSYVHLAWIKATCPDASVRNGAEAVSAATKACELTGWKNGEWIDTLAAACAETGDFKRAIEFEEQALRTGNPQESKKQEMQERLSLYKQSRPFRDKP